MAKRSRRKHVVSASLAPSTYHFLLGAVDGRKEKLGDIVSAIVDMVVSKTTPEELKLFAEQLFRRPRKRKTAEQNESPEAANTSPEETTLEKVMKAESEKPAVVPMDSEQ